MRKLVLGLALASSALASPAFARDDSWYVEADAGAMKVEDSEALNGQVVLSNHDGYDFGGIVGYDFGGFRLESEVSYRRAYNETVDFGAQTFTNPQGHADALSFMVNGLLDFGPDDGLQGFVGGGVGVARAKYFINAAGNSVNGLYVNDSDTGFAWQALAGIRAPISDHVDVGLKYRFFNADKVDLVADDGTGARTRFRSHSILGTLSYNFGGAAPVEEAAPV
ncbi:outer membrane protein, partial [Novosphingobium sp. CCH12-A3]|uniref:outer membrane protein n=1 Tax=Novosphingobium sp. CCH12-A3 TaxID=1768752 RepID=UPI000B2717D0